ncbi:MAG: uracil-DNA glycosylase [Salaquimonas sp.]
MKKENHNPDYNCPLCPRLVEFRDEWREKEPAWHNGPVDTWVAKAGDDQVKMMIIGLAPGLRGANLTGRPFTGDYAGDLLYSTLLKFGFAQGAYKASPDDEMQLVDCAITNAVRCVPPQNKPVGEEINNCRPFLLSTLARFPNLKALVTLGKIAHDTTTRAMGERVAAHPFKHAGQTEMGRYTVFSSYHCSRYNTNTNVLTPEMFEKVFHSVREYVD